MIYELSEADYGKVQPVFRPLAEYLLFCAAVLEGNQPGRVYVDDPVTPRSACMITRDVWCYVVGEPDNDAFIRALNKAIYTREVVSEEAGALLFHCYPEAWREGLAVVCAPRQPIETGRRRYICRELTYDWRAKVPEGFAVQWVDESLLERPGLEIPDDVRNVIEARGSSGDPMRKGFGFVTFHDGKIAAHAVVDCIVGEMGDIGLVTAEDYRRRGLATTTAAAVVEYGLSHGLAMVNWDCGEHNVGSVRTAEKLGFERERDHRMYLVVFDETWHLVNLAWNRLEAEHYQETIDTCGQIFALGKEAPAYAYFPAACAWAGLGKRDKALEYLNKAVDRGWDSVDETMSCREFEALHGTPEWVAVVERIQKNRQRKRAGQ